MWIFKTILFKILKTIFLIIYLIAKYKLFKKMGEKGWKALIPVYSEIVLFRNLKINIGFTILFVLLKLFSVILTIIWFVSILIGLLFIISIILYQFHDHLFNFADGITDVNLYIDFLIYLIQIYAGYVLALKFGKDKTTAIILGIINPIEIIIFGFGSDKYLGGNSNGESNKTRNT